MGGKTIAFTSKSVEYSRMRARARVCVCMHGTPVCTGLVMLVLCNVHASLEHEIPRRSFLSRRAIDGTRGRYCARFSRIGADACPFTINKQRSRFRKYFDPEEEGAFDSFGSAGGQYNPYQEKTGRDFDLFHLFSFFFFFSCAQIPRVESSFNVSI